MFDPSNDMEDETTEDSSNESQPDDEFKVPGARRLSASDQAESDAMLNPNPALNPIFQKVTGRNLSLGGGIEMIMRNQVLSAYNAVESHERVLTTTELRNKQDAEKEAIIAIERAKLSVLKVSQVKGSSKNVRGAVIGEKVPTPATIPKAEPGLEPKPVKGVASLVKVKPKKRRPSQKPPPEEATDSELEEPDGEKHSHRFVSIWEQYADEGPPEVEVGFESAPPPQPFAISTAKMFNVMLQVKPRDISTVSKGPDAMEVLSGSQRYKVIAPRGKPKMMDVSMTVHPRDKDFGIPFKNAAVQARPRGYKELDLGVPFETQLDEKEIQVTEMEIEKSTAVERGRMIRPGDVLWPTILEFKRDLAEMKIKTYIQAFWKLGPGWMFDLRYVQTHTTNYRKKIIYEVIFSRPTKEHPVPPATASVFFLFESLHYSCPDQIMRVHYLLEGNRYPYKTGAIAFREEWLFGIIENKMKIQKALHWK